MDVTAGTTEESAAGPGRPAGTGPAPRPPWLAAGLTAAVLAAAIAAGALATSVTFGPLIFVDSVSGRFSGLFLELGAVAPLSYAFVAGMVAAFNPCGFVLLPAYLGLYLGDEQAVRARQRVGRALVVSVTVTASFVLLFGLVGILAGWAASGVTSALPWIGLVIGVGLVLTGGALAAGRGLYSNVGPRVAQRLSGLARVNGVAGYAAYGTAYGLASLGCALPVFLSVVGTSLQAHGIAAAAGQFVLYGVGMGTVLGALTVIAAWTGSGRVARASRAVRHARWASAVLLWLAGGYVVYYWLLTIRLL
jgi:cytochrome c-type biogenesis protein